MALRCWSRNNATLSRISWIFKESNLNSRSMLWKRSVTAGLQHGDESQSTPVESTSHSQTQSSLDLSKNKSEHETFEYLFENSQFVRVMNPVGKRVRGEIIAVVGENLYVDFGCKFHAVVKAPKEESELYHKGSAVVVLVKSLEVTDHFLGDSKHTSLLEAEAELIGLLND